MAPISLFLLINLGYFFSVTLSDLNLSLQEHISYQLHSPIAKRLVDSRTNRRHISLDDYAVTYNEQSTSLSKTLIILHAPTLALLLMPVYRKRNYYFTDHMILSIYLMSFVMLFSLILYNVLIGLVKLSVIRPEALFPISGYAIMLVLTWHFGLAIKRFYNLRWLPAIFGTLVVLVCFVLAHLIFRAELFLIVFLTT
jgi:hypothetical protein